MNEKAKIWEFNNSVYYGNALLLFKGIVYKPTTWKGHVHRAQVEHTCGGMQRTEYMNVAYLNIKLIRHSLRLLDHGKSLLKSSIIVS